MRVVVAAHRSYSIEANSSFVIFFQEKLSLYCETCDRLTCRDCQLVDHRDHKYKFANEIASETRNALQALLSEISYKKVLLSSAMKVIDDRQALITEKKKELSKEIADLVVKLTNAVNMRGKQLVYRLNQVSVFWGVCCKEGGLIVVVAFFRFATPNCRC